MPSSEELTKGKKDTKGSAEEEDEGRFVSVEDLPNDPLAMPPPFWRAAAAIFHVVEALKAILRHLPQLTRVIARTDRKLEKHYAKYPENSEEHLDEFSEICDGLWELEHRIKLESERAILMSAIQAEDEVNQFCVFNLHKDLAETIEKLSLSEKLIVAAGVLGKNDVKSTAVYEKAKKLTVWRNAFVHGHCVDRPVKSLRHNHLISPAEYPGVPSAVRDVTELGGAFVGISIYLESIRVNPYTASKSFETEEVKKMLFRISQFAIVGSENIYSVARPVKKTNRKRLLRSS